MALRDFLEQAWADVNPFDNGATGATIRAKKKPDPAPMPSPGGGRPSIQSFRPAALPTLTQQPQIQHTVMPPALTVNSAIHPPMAAAVNPAPKPPTPAFDPLKAAGDVIHGAGSIVNDYVVKPVVDSTNTMGNAFASQIGYIGKNISGQDAAQRNDMLQHQADAMKERIAASQIHTGAPLAPATIQANTATKNQLLRTAAGNDNIGTTIQQDRMAERDQALKANDPVKIGAAGVNLIATVAAPGMAGLADNIAARTLPAVGETASRIIGGAVSQMPVGAVLGATGQLQQTGSQTKLGDFAASTALGAVGGGIIGGAAPIVGNVARGWMNGSEKLVNHGADVTTPATRAGEAGFAKVPGGDKPVAPVPDSSPLGEAKPVPRPMTEWPDQLNGQDPRVPQQSIHEDPAYLNATAKANAFKDDVSDIRTQHGNDDAFYNDVILNNVEKGGDVGDFARHVARRVEGRGEKVGDVLDDVLTKENPAADAAALQGAHYDDVTRSLRDLEKSSGQTGLYKKVMKQVADQKMSQNEATQYIGGALKQARDDGTIAAAKFGKKAGGEDPRPIESEAPLTEKAASQESTLPPEAQTSPTDTVPSSSEPIISNKTTDVKLNTNRLHISDEAKVQLDKETAETLDRMSNKELQDAAEAAGIDYKSYGEVGTKKKITEQLNLRRQASEVVTAAENAQKSGNLDDAAKLLEHAAELGRTSRSQGTDIARQLQARRIIADQMNTPQQKIFRLLDEAGIDPKVYSKRLAGVDFNDANAVVEAYRDLVPAKFTDWLDKYRYTNMLSAPLTHIVNMTSNAQGILGVRPLQQGVEGALDAVHSAVTGKARTRFAGEAKEYYKAAFKSVPEAVTNFKNVMAGKKNSEMLDTQQITNGRLATKGIFGKLDTTLSFVPKLLEASDQLGVTISKSGEKAALEFRQGKGAKVASDLDGLAQDAANYSLFRQELGKNGQGAVLEAIDAIPKTILALRNHKNKLISTTAKFTIPFVTTPTNLFKQGLEFSPAGIITIPGSADKTAQVAKVVIGSAAMGITAAAFAANDAITFSEPSDAKQRDAFRAEGKQPYAVKVGNTWIGYSRLHPAIAFNLAMVGAVKDSLDKGAIDQSAADKILQIGSGALGFFRDQSYMKSVGDFTNTIQLKDGATIADAAATMATNWGNQMVPFKSMVSWIGRMVDPTQRKVDYSKSTPEQIYQGLVKDIPGLNSVVAARVNPYDGTPIKNDHPIINSFLPTRITDDRGYGNTTGLNMDQRMIQSALPTDQRPQFRQSTIDEKFLDKKATDEETQIKKATEQLTANSSGGANANLASANTGSSSNDDVHALSNGKYYAKVGDSYKTFDTEQQANDAIDSKNKSVALGEFKTSGKKTAEIDGKTYYKKGDGTVGSKSTFEYKADQQDADLSLNMSRSKAKGDLKSWTDSADKSYDLIQQRIKQLDPDTQSDEIDALLKKADSLSADYAKYAGYGGFTKPKAGKGGGKKTLDYKIDGYGTGATGTAKSLREILRSAHLSKAKA